MIRSVLSATARKFILAGGLALGLAAAAPAAAADNAQFGFSFGNGNEGFSFSLGNGGYIGRHFTSPPPQRVCMNENQMRSTLRAKGYRWIHFGQTRYGWVHVSAKRMGRDFQFDMNRCNGAIANLVAVGGWNNGGWNNGGFGGGWNDNGWNGNDFNGGFGFNR